MGFTTQTQTQTQTTPYTGFGGLVTIIHGVINHKFIETPEARD
jgi:hypothetical protein